MAVEKLESNEIETILKSMVRDYKESYRCNYCNDSGYIRTSDLTVKQCSCLCDANKQTIQEKIKKVFGNHKIEKFTSDQTHVDRQLKAANKNGIWLWGETGKGKSAYAYHKIINYNKKVLAISGKEIDQIFREQLEDGSWLKKDWKSHLSQYDMIAIDDIDKRWKFTEAMLINVFDLLDEIVKKRTIKLIITANMSLEKFCSVWEDHIRDPLQRRLYEYIAEIKI